jgi:3-dehydroquinate synthase
MVGTFNQPQFVICDPQMLTTLPADQLDSGFAEIVKHTLIADRQMFEYLEENAEKALNLDMNVIETLVDNSVNIKSGVVNRDEKEHGERRKLNLGHTYGHAAEKVLGVSHGYAVSLGLVVAARLSVKRGLLSQADADRIVALLRKLNLPTVITGDKQAIYNALELDKKREGSQINFVLMRGIGDVVIEKIDINELKQIEL